MPLSGVISDLKGIRNNRDDIILDIIVTIEEYVLNLNRNQLSRGINEKGNPITPSYSISYKIYKSSRGLPVNKVNLKLEGDFYANFIIEYGNDYFEITSLDAKTGALESKYSKTGDIFGLTPKSMSRLGKKIKPKLQKYIRQILK